MFESMFYGYLRLADTSMVEIVVEVSTRKTCCQVRSGLLSDSRQTEVFEVVS
jgi:hypothetical protein